MPELSIHKGLWEDFVTIAEKQRQKPERLAQRVLRDYIQRFTDHRVNAVTGYGTGCLAREKRRNIT